MSHYEKRGYLPHHIRCGRIIIALLVIINIVLVLGHTTSTPRKLIIGLTVVILCHLTLGYLQYNCN